jgi:hypothetical protein
LPPEWHAALSERAALSEMAESGDAMPDALQLLLGNAESAERSQLAPSLPSTASESFAAVLAQVTRGIGSDADHTLLVDESPAAADVAGRPVVPSVPDPLRDDPLPPTPLRAAQAASGAVPVAPMSAGPFPGAPLQIPRLLYGAGDLIVVVGCGTDAAAVAYSMSIATGARVVNAGCCGNADERVNDRRSALHARAAGVRAGTAVLVAFGLPRGGRDAGAAVPELDRLAPDQLWLAVDAGRKADDTAGWVDAIARRVPVDALAVLGSDATATPETVQALALPIGWQDGRLVDPESIG